MSELPEPFEPLLEIDWLDLDPGYNTAEDSDVPLVWEMADRIRFLLGQTTHDTKDREELATAVTRQVRTVVLYKLVSEVVRAATKAGTRWRLDGYVILFPGEGRHNTGIKDLNDNVLGYTLNQEFVRRRQQAIGAIFHPDFFVVGQDYKTALLVSHEAPRQEFDTRLRTLDGVLRAILLELLPKSDKPAAKDLKAVLEKNPDYRFDLYYGLNAVGDDTTHESIVQVFLLLTEALKAAATARYIARGASLKVRVVKAFGRNASSDKKFDTRGKAFTAAQFQKVIWTAPAIKTFMLKPEKEHDLLLEYNHILVDTVWTLAFFRHQNAANRDVVRDVRKKKLVKPKLPDVKHTFEAQKELLEVWIVVLNLVDLIKDFLEREFPQDVRAYHDLAARVFDNVRDPGRKVDTRQASDLLTRDLRGRQLAVLGAASEFQFYAGAADHAERVIFVLDVRDLGVEVLLMYDRTIARILDRRLDGRPLLEETIRSTDEVAEMRRFTYDLVISTFGRYHKALEHAARLKRTDGRSEAARAFRRASDPVRDFNKDVQVLLGGDEFIVTAHPRFAAYAHLIVADLAQTLLGPGPMGPDRRAGSLRLGVRTGVAFSAAKTPGDRQAHQLAHHQALKLADESHGVLKDLERRHRRIERLIEKLEENPRKRADAPKFRQQLDRLSLMRLFARVQHGRPTVLDMKRFERAVEAMRAGRLPRRQDVIVELVDFAGKVLDPAAVLKNAQALEDIVRKKAGRDNVHVDLPPAKKV